MRTKKTLITAALVAAGFITVSLSIAQEHAHKAPHGGQVITVGSYHYEFLVKPGEIDIYVLDGKENVLSPKGMEGTLIVQLPDKTKKELKLELAGDYFKAAIDTASLQSFIAIATIKIDGKPNVGRFSYPPKEAVGSPPAVPATAYTCPMHPEVRQTTPGRCPKCGMTLEAATEGHQHEGHEHK